VSFTRSKRAECASRFSTSAAAQAEEDDGEAGGGGVAGGGDFTSEALVKMMFRIRDEEESIQQLVVESFRERWFAGDVASQDRRAHELMLVVWQVRAHEVMLVVWHVRASWRCCASLMRDRRR
jgi:hypothetical protein